nr:MAG TPA: Metallothionein Cu(I) metallothionein, Cu(I) metallothionein.44A [Caudoviricetes sp.]
MQCQCGVCYATASILYGQTALYHFSLNKYKYLRVGDHPLIYVVVD